MKAEERLWSLIGRSLSESLTEEECLELKHLLLLYPHGHFVLDILTATGKESGTIKKMVTETAYERLRRRMIREGMNFASQDTEKDKHIP